MKLLIVLSALLVVSTYAQGPQRRQFQDEYQDQDQPQQQPQQQPQVARQQQPQQNFNNDPNQRRHESTTFIPIIRFDKEQGEDGSYKTAWETGNNIIAEETGFLKTIPSDEPNEPEGHAQVQHGSYTYTAPDGQVITVTYTADEHGFRATGDHLPTPPPISAEVQKGLDLIYAGIKAQQEAVARDEREHPERVREREAAAVLNNNGFYRPE